LLFLNMYMHNIYVFRFLYILDKKPMDIITTAHSQYAIKVFELQVLDYLVKPVSLPRFIKAVNKAMAKVRDRTKRDVSQDHIFVKVDKKKMKKIYLDDIILVESLKDYIKIVTSKGNHIVHSTLSAFTEELSADHFIRIHRSHTVSMDKIDAVEGNSVEIGGRRFVIGRSYLEDVKNRILNQSGTLPGGSSTITE